MAFRAFDEWQHVAAAEPQRMAARVAAAPQPVFTATERSVIALARHDRPSSVRSHRLLGRVSKTLFGIAPPNPLADPRLEALRRFAVLARAARGHPPQPEIERFLAAGYTPHAAFALTSLSR